MVGNKVLIMTLILIGGLFISSPKFNNMVALYTQKVSVIDKTNVEVPSITEKAPNIVDAAQNELKPKDELASNPIKLKVLTLEESNTVVFRMPVATDSVMKAMQTMQKLSTKLPDSGEIYLVLDTPGGSVFDGLDFIDFYQALPQKVNSVTLFAASMGFQFVQNTEKRYISRTGMLMSHRAAGGVSGQFDGELETRYAMVKRSIDYLDTIAANRMDMPVRDYKQMIVNEYWVSGFDAVKDKAADEQILIRCGTSLQGSEFHEFKTIFGPVTVEFSKCPLLKGFLSLQFGSMDATTITQVRPFVETLFSDKQKFVKDYIITNKLSNFVELKHK